MISVALKLDHYTLDGMGWDGVWFSIVLHHIPGQKNSFLYLLRSNRNDFRRHRAMEKKNQTIVEIYQD